MTSGQRLDTNSQWLSLQLEVLGLRVLFHTTVADSLDANISVFRQAIKRADIVVSTGGLGPTQDDLTRQALAEGFDRKLELRPEALAHIANLFRRRGRPMAERNRVQALFPEGSSIIPNPHGTAPGIEMEIPRSEQSDCRIFSLPGVPAEMVEMWLGTVQSRIKSFMTGGLVVRSAVIKCFGAGESEMEALIPDLIARDHQPAVGITVNRATISLRIRAEAATEAEALAEIETVRQQILERVGQWVFGEGEEFELQHVVLEILAAERQTLCTLELGCGALLSLWLSNLESPDFYLGGLNIADRLPHFIDAVVLHDTVTLANQFLRATNADWLLGVERYPPVLAVLASGRSLPCQPEREVHSVRIFAIQRSTLCVHEHTIELAGHPEILHHRIAKSALDWFRKGLLSSWT